MKHILLLSVLLLCVLQTGLAQVSRSNTKKSVPYRANYQRMSTSAHSYHSLEIRNGTLWGWGRNLYGELGDGTYGNQRNSAVQIGTDNKWVTVATGGMHTLAIKADGTLWAWGYNGNSQLGDATTTNRTTPVQIGTDNKWTSVVAGNQFSIALKADGTLWAWGNNSNGQLGDGTITTRTVPIKIGTDNKWTSISAGNGHTLALKADGTLWTWGNNAAGQLGDGATTNRLTPDQIGKDDKWTNIAAGYQFSLGLKADGTLWSWGANASGQLGIGNTTSQSTPVQVGADNTWVTISAGETFSTALKANGTFWTWGVNFGGQLGDGTTVNKSSPIQVDSDTKWVSVFAGATHTLCLKADGTLWSFGSNTNGQLGDGTIIQRNSSVQINSAADEWIQISCGVGHTAGIKANGTLWAWGQIQKLYFTPPIDQVVLLSPIKIGTDNNWISVTAGNNISFGLKSDGTLWSWGTGYLGNNSIGYNQLTPVQIGLDAKWVSISAGDDYILALKGDGTLWGWGSNADGQLGDGTIAERFSPVQIGIDNKWVLIKTQSVSNISQYSAALKSDGSLWTWGNNQLGQLGIGTTLNKSSPVQVGTETKWLNVGTGFHHTIGLKADGSLWSWGFNGFGELGDGTLTDRLSPTAIAIGIPWLSISLGSDNSAGLKPDGTLWTWGYGGSGELGNGTNLNKNSPTAAGINNIWLYLSLSNNRIMGIKSGRIEYCGSGYNPDGQLGDGTLISKNTFTCNTGLSPCSPPNNSLTISGTTAVCPSAQNRIFIVTNSISGATYTWTVPSGVTIVSGQNTSTLTVNWGTTAGIITAAERNACGVQGTAASFAVAISPPSSVLPIVTGPASVCPAAVGQVLSVSNASTGSTYLWTVPSGVTIISGQGTATLMVNWGTIAGTLSVAETTCGTGTAVTKAVALSPVPNNALVVNGPTSVCSYNYYTFAVTNPAAGANYNWIAPSGGSIVSGQGTASATIAWGTVNGSVSVSETTVCGTGTVASKAATVSTSYYTLGNTDAFCGSTFAVPLKTIGTISSGIIGLDFAINYNAALITPTGAVQSGTVATSYGSYSINTATPGKVYVSVYLNNAPNGTYFNGNGDVAYVYFQVNTGVAAGTVFTLTTDGIEESAPVNTNVRCAAVPLSTTVKAALGGTLIYRSTAGAYLKYDPANPAAYVAANITGVSSVCAPGSSAVSRPDLNGMFKFSSGSGDKIVIQRDITGEYNLPPLNCSNVQSVINSMDRIQAADIATYKTTNVPIYALLSADVNLDGKVTAGDVSLISSRSINANNCEFPQNNYTWNGTALVPASGYIKSQDWLFVDDATLASAAFTTGTGRNNVPKVPSCLPAPTGTASCTPSSSATYHAILLGDVDGSWTTVNGSLLRTATTDAIIVDLSQATVNAVGNYVVPVFYQTEGAYYGLDFSIDYTNGITIHQVSVNTSLANTGAQFNTIAQQRLMVTSYTQDPINTTLPIAYIEVSASGTLTPNNFSNAQGYLNGQQADLKFGFDKVLAKNTAHADIYPNPFHTETYLYAEDINSYVSVSIFDMSGALVYENNQVPANERVLLNHLTEAGMYLVRITCSNGTVTKKLVKI